MFCSMRPVIATASEGRLLYLKSRHVPHLYYYLYLPAAPDPDHRGLVSVHGISRNAEDHMKHFRRQADRFGVSMLAPVFTGKHFGDYQRLGRKGRGMRADLALLELMREVSGLYDLDLSRVNIFGYSGGGQFSHRFAFAHPDRVGELMMGAPGWYTWPDSAVSYPYGIADAKGLEGVEFDPVAITKLRFTIVVGERDTSRDAELNQSRRACRQGRNRIDRGRNWADAMNSATRELNGTGHVRFLTLQRTAHSFDQAVINGGLDKLLFESFYAREQAAVKNHNEPDPEFLQQHQHAKPENR